MIRWKQAVEKFVDFGMTFNSPDFVSYAQAYGAQGSRAEATEDLVPVLQSALERAACTWWSYRSTFQKTQGFSSTNFNRVPAPSEV